MTKLRVSFRDGRDDLNVEVSESYALVLRYRQPNSLDTEPVDLALSLHDTIAIEVVGAPQPLPAQGGFVRDGVVYGADGVAVPPAEAAKRAYRRRAKEPA